MSFVLAKAIGSEDITLQMGDWCVIMHDEGVILGVLEIGPRVPRRMCVQSPHQNNAQRGRDYHDRFSLAGAS